MHNRITDTKIIRNLTIPDNINVEVIDSKCTFTKSDNKIDHIINKNITININKKILTISTNLKNITKKTKNLAIINTTYILFKNYITGLLTPFEKTLILKGVGYKAEYQKNLLKLSLGFSHPVIFKIPDDIDITLNTPTSICIKGASKFQVGQIAHEIKMKRPVEIYKGNGIRYKNEIIKLKSAKKTK